MCVWTGGARLADGADEGEYACPECGTAVEPTWKACPNCGVEFEGPEEEAAPQAPPSSPAAPAGTPRATAAAPAVRPPAAAAGGAAPKPPAPSGKPAKAGKGAGRPRSGLIARFGLLGIIGILVLAVGAGGFVAVYNYDVWFANQSEILIGPNQMMAIWAAAAVTAVGAGLFAMTLFGFGRPRAAPREELATAEGPQPDSTQPQARAYEAEAYEAPAPVAAPVEGPSPYEPPAPEAPPGRAVPASAAVAQAPAPPVQEEAPGQAEEEEAIEIPAKAPAAPAKAPAALPAGAPASGSDELEDLFGELESEVAATEEEEVHYECPNCHGIVREDDASCPHCQVVFESG